MKTQRFYRAKKYISEELILAISIDDFKQKNGRRRMSQPYWIVSLEPGQGGKMLENYIFNFIHPETDVRKLKSFIDTGRVWTLPRYLDRND